MRITTTRLHALLHLKVVTVRLKAIERQGTLTAQEREVLSEHLDRAYDPAAALLHMGGTRHAAQ